MPFVVIMDSNIFFRGPEKIDAKKPALIFVHGAGGTGKRWEKQLAALSGECQCIAVDLPGHGNSTGSPCQSIGDYAKWINEFCRALGLEKVILCGHSMGGAIVIEYALQHPDGLIGLILTNTGAKLRVAPAFLEMLSRGIKSEDNIHQNFAAGVNENLLTDAREDMQSTPAEVYLADFKACDRFDCMERIAEINVPTLVIGGEEDKKTPVKYSRYLQSQIKGAKLHIIPNAGHMTILEQPELVSRYIGDFIKGLN